MFRLRFHAVRRAPVTCVTAVAVISALFVTACDSAGGAAPTPTVTVALATTTGPASTSIGSAASTSTTTSTTAATTVPAPTSTTLDDLKTQIAADFQRSSLHEYDLLVNPSLDNLDAKVDDLAPAGSDFHATIVATIRDLVAKGDRVIANDPDILKVTVENVELVGEPPYTEATVTSCTVENRKRVTPAENSPTGTEIEVGDSGLITAYHTVEPVRLTEKGWLRYATNITGDVNKGHDAC
jgi:hypothetical protein